MGTLVLFLALVASAVAGPLSPHSGCAKHCVESSKFQYQPGTVYSYRYQARSVTSLQGSLQDESILHMTALVDVEVISKCDMALRLREVDLDGSDDLEFKNALQRHVLKFAFQDGRITELCTRHEDPSWVLNVKRGILSALQNTMTRLDRVELVSEVDVNGRCEAQYNALGTSWTGTITIRKNKNLTLCEDRAHSQSAFQTNPDSSMMYQDIKSLPLVSGMQSCEQSFKRGILQKTSCSEMHIFKPFARHKSSVITKSTQSLVFSGESRNTFAGNEYHHSRSNLLFDHAYSRAATPIDQVEAEAILSKLCTASQEDIRPAAPELFTQFVYKLRHLEHGALRSLLSSTSSLCSDATKARRMFLDALPMIGTPGAVRLMVELVKTNEITRKEAEFWISTVSFYKNPSADMISTLTTLVEGDQTWALLGVSSLGHTFCQSQQDCQNIPEIRQLVQAIMSHIERGCQGVEASRAILALKALGNLGVYPEQSIYLKSCFENPQNEMEVRLAAIQSFRKFSCEHSREDLLNIYKNVNQEVELRIATFIASVVCPSRATVQTIHDTLKSEPINQVGSFVWSYLTSKYIPLYRDILSDRALSKMFADADALKFSRAFSGQAFFDALDVGTQADAQVVFSPSSYLPRSGLFNLTLDILGNSINIFEIGGRMEGFERMVERFFGPDGYLPQENIHEMLGALRGKRSPSKIKEFEQAFDPSRLEKEPLASIYMKIFGNELWYSRLGQDSGEGWTLLDILRSLSQDQDMEMSKSILFLDSTHTLPMGTGFPLKVALNGSASVSLKLGGKFEVRNFDHVDVRARIQPSGAVTISSLITVEAGESSRTGLKVRATAHSSTMLDGLVEIRNGRAAKARFNFPRERLEIFDVRSEFYLVRNNDIVASSHRPEPVENVKSCSQDVLGLRVCAAFSTPRGPSPNSPLCPFSGPAVAQVTLEKIDLSLTGYSMDAVWRDGRASIVLNTPGSRVNREVALNALWTTGEENSFTLKAKIPDKTAEFSAKLVNSESMKQLRLGMLVNDVEYATFDTELALTRTAQEFSVTPLLQIRGPRGRLLAISGSGLQVQRSTCAVQLILEDVTSVPIVVRGNVEKQKERYQGQIAVTGPNVDTELKGYVQTSRDSVSSKLSLNYKLGQQRKHTIDTNFKFRDLSASSLTKYNAMVSFMSSQFPQTSSSITWEMQSTQGHLENTMQLSLGDSKRGRIHKITMQKIIKYQTIGPKNSAAVTLKFTYPERNIDHFFDMKHEHSDKSLNNRINIQYAPGKVVSTIVDLMMDISKKILLKGDLQVQTPSREMKLLATLNEQKPKEYQLLTTVQWQRGKQIQLSGNFKDRGTASSCSYQIDGELMLSKKRSITFSSGTSLSKELSTFTGDMDIFGSKYRINTEYNKPSTSMRQFNAQINVPGKFHTFSSIFNLNSNEMRSSIDLKIDTIRHIISNLEVSKEPEGRMKFAYTTMWDADVDETKKLSIGVDIDSFKDPSPIINVLIRYQPRQVQAIYKCMLIENGAEQSLYIDWDASKKIAAELNHIIDLKRPENLLNFNFWVNTPFENYKKQRLYFSHNHNENYWKTTLEILSGKSIAITTTGKKEQNLYKKLITASLDVNTTFAGYESLDINVQHEKNQERMHNRLEISWSPNKMVSTGITTTTIPNGFRANFDFSGPFEKMYQLDASATHSGTSEEFSSDAQMRWNNGRQVELKIEGKKPSKSSGMLSVQASSPYKDYETLGTKVAYRYDANSFDTVIELLKNENKITLGADGKKSQRKQAIVLEGKAFASTPYRGYDNMLMKIKHHSDSENFKTSIDAQTHSRGLYYFKCQGKVPSSRNFDILLTIETPVNGYRKISSKLLNKINSNNMQTVFELTSDNKMYNAILTGSHFSSYESGKLEGSLELNAPINGMEHLKMYLDYQRQNNEKFITKITGLKNNEIYTLSHELLFKPWDILENTLSIKPFFKYNEMKSFLKTRLSSGMMTFTSTMEGDEMKLHSINVDYQNNMQRSEKDIRGSLNLEFPNLKKSLDLSGYLKNNAYNYIAALSYNCNDQGSIKKMAYEGTLHYQHSARMNGKMSLTTNYPGYEALILEGNLDAASPEKKSELSAQWGRREVKRISFMAQISGSLKNGESKIILTTPYNVFKKFELYCNNDFTTDSKTGRFVAKLDSRVEHFVSLSMAIDPTSINLETASSCPLLKTLTMEANFRKNEGKFIAKWNENKYLDVHSYINSYDSKNTLKITLRSSFQGMETLNLEASLENTLVKKQFIVASNWGTDVYLFMISFDQDLKSAEIKLTSPFNGFRKHVLEAKWNLNDNSKSYVLTYTKDNDKTILELKQEGDIKNGDIEITFTSPYEILQQLSLGCSHTLGGSTKKIDFRASINNGMPFTFSSQLHHNKNKLNLDMNVQCPRHGKMSLEFKGQTKPNMRLKTDLKWGNDRYLLLNANVDEAKRLGEKGQVEIKFKSSFEKMNEINLKGYSRWKPWDAEGGMSLDLDNNQKYTFTSVLNNNELNIHATTPLEDNRAIAFVCKLHHEESSIELSRDNQMARLSTEIRKIPNGKMAKVIVTSSFSGYEYSSIEGSVETQDPQNLKAKLSLTTPYESIKNMNFIFELAKTNAGSQLSSKLEMPRHIFSVDGYYKNDALKPFEFNLIINAPSTPLKKFQTAGKMHCEGSDFTEGEIKMIHNSKEHKLNLFIKNEEGISRGKILLASPSIYNKKIEYNYNVNYHNKKNIMGVFKIETSKNIHRLQFDFKNNQLTHELFVNMECPYLKEGKMSISVSCTNAKKKMYKIIVDTPRSNPHELSVEFEKSPDTFSSNVTAKCDYLTEKAVSVQGTFYAKHNAHGMAILVETPKVSHTFSTALKRQDDEISAEMIVNCPSSTWKSFEISSNLKNKRNELIAGAFKIGTLSEETRFSFLVKRTKWERLEALATFNSPYPVLKMSRFDILYVKNENGFESTVDLITSNPKFDKFGVITKFKSIPSTGNMGLTIKTKLPVQRYETIELVTLCNSKKEGHDLSISSKATISFPDNKYSVFYTYEPKNAREQIAKGGYEWNGKAIEIVGIFKKPFNLQTFSHKFFVITPFRNHEKYELYYAMQHDQATSKTKYEISMKLPRNEEYRLDGIMIYPESNNMDFKIKVFTPLEGWDMTAGHLRWVNQVNNKAYLLEIAEQSNIYSIRADYRDGNKGDIQILTPNENLKKLQILFVADGESRSKNLNAAIKLNEDNLMNLDAEALPSGIYNIDVKLPTKKWAAHIEASTLPSNRKLTVTTSIPSRNMIFAASLQKDSKLSSHGAKFSWEDGKEVSYQVQVVEVSNSKREYYGTVNFPSRSLEMKTTCFHGDSLLRVKTDFYWDLLRHAHKHASIELEHENLSSWKATAHNVRLAFYHYKLPKEISLKARVSANGEEDKTANLELEYSPNPANKIELGGRVRILAQDSLHYGVVLTALHPASNTDVKINGEIASSRAGVKSATLKTQYLDIQRQRQNAEMRFSSQHGSTEFMVQFPHFHLTQKCRNFNRDLEYSFLGETEYNHQPMVPMHIKFSQRHHTLDLSLPLSFNERQFLTIHGKIPQESLQLKIKRSTMDSPDVDIFAGLEDSEHLVGKFQWRPNFLQGLGGYLTAKKNDISDMARTFQTACEDIAKSLSQRKQMFVRSLPEEITKDIATEWNSLSEDIEHLSNYVSNMYNQDHLYMKTGAKNVVKAWAHVKPHLQKMATLQTQLVVNLKDFMSRQMSRCVDAVSNIDLSAVLDTVTRNLEYATKFLYNKLIASIPQGVKDKVHQSAEILQAYYMGTIEFLSTHSLVTSMRHYLDRVRATIEKFEWEVTQKEVRATIKSSLTSLLGPYDYIVSHPLVIYVAEVSSSAMEKGLYIYHYLGLPDFISDFNDALIKKVRENFWDLFYRVSDEMVALSRKVTYDYSPGVVNVRVNLLSPRQSLAELTDFSSEVQNFKGIWSEYLYGDFSFWDLFYTYKRYLDPATWLVPVKSYALIAGDQHFVTFDGRHYDFKAGCSYLLTHDFLDKNFSAWITFGKQGGRLVKKSITVEVEGHEIQLGTDFKVTLDGRRSELPFQLTRAEVTRRGSVVEVNSGRGFSVLCNFVHDVCVVELSTFYMGRVGGLLGNPDHEPNLDFLTPDRRLASSIDEFAKSWSLSDNCPIENKADMISQDPMAETFCRGLFEAKDSLFRPCYKMVDPVPYLHMCLNDLSNADHHLQQKKLCISSAAYRSQCSIAGVPLRMPGPCVDCGNQGDTVEGPLREGELLRVEGTETADVVYLVEEKRCSDTSIRTLPKLAVAIDDAMTQNGIASTRHAAVGFGGSGVHAPPHVHTAEGQLFGSARSVESAFLSLVTGEGPSNAFEAIRFAASLPFRAGAIKTFILIKCSECGSEDSKADYGEMLRTLIDNDIQLHVVMEQDFEMKTDTKKHKSKKILGLDDTYVYTLKDVKDMSGDSMLLPQVRMPKDLCVPLALEVQGSLFSSKFLPDPRRSKRLMDVLGRRVAKTATVPQCQVCECLADQDGVGATSCRSCVTRDFDAIVSDPSQSKIYQYNSDFEDLEDELL